MATTAAVQLIERELAQTEGELAKAKLAGQLQRLADGVRRAEERAAPWLSDPPADALVVLGDLSFEAKRALEAAKHYEGVVGRADTLERSEAIRVLVHYVDALSQTGSEERWRQCFALLRLAPDDMEALARVALVTFENSSPKRAAELFDDLLSRFGSRMSDVERGQAQYRLGRSGARAATSKAPKNRSKTRRTRIRAAPCRCSRCRRSTRAKRSGRR